jgi:hypothetical protein
LPGGTGQALDELISVHPNRTGLLRRHRTERRAFAKASHHVGAGNPSPEAFGVADVGGPDERGQILPDHAEIAELLIETASRQHHGIFQFALLLLFRARSRKLPAMIVVPIVMAAISNSPPLISQRIGPPRTEAFTSMKARASVIGRSDSYRGLVGRNGGVLSQPIA